MTALTEEFVAVDATTVALVARIDQVAAVDCTVLLTGESGTGKDLLANRIFQHSARKQRQFVPINCGAISHDLVDSELFGHRKGAYTGAVNDYGGLIREADRGVLFLDEIGEMPLAVQVRLLRFLDSGEVRGLGEANARSVDVRIVAATNCSLEAAVRSGAFRLDLFYRLNVVSIVVPPLRERAGDISALACLFLARSATRLQKRISGFSGGAMSLLTAHAWPGNVRELQNAVMSAVIMTSGSVVTEDALPASLTRDAQLAPVDTSWNSHQRQRMVSALHDSDGNHGLAAKAMGISRTTMWRRLKHPLN